MRGDEAAPLIDINETFCAVTALVRKLSAVGACI